MAFSSAFGSLPSEDWRRPAFAAGAVLFLTVGVLGGWAAMAKLDSAVVSSGRIVVEGERKVVQHLEGGLVSEILVKPDSYVNEGDVLLRVDPTQAKAGADMVDNQLVVALADEARLVAISSGSATISFPPGVPQSVQDDQSRQFQQFEASKQTETAILSEQVRQAETQIGGYKEQRKGIDFQMGSAQADLDQLRPLLAEQLVAANDVRARERMVSELETQLSAIDAEVARLTAVISETELKVAQVTQQAAQEASAKLVEVRRTIADLKQRALVSEDIVGRSEVRAPRSGKVVGMTVHTVGQVIQPGATLLEIVPDAEALVVSARMSPLDVTHVHPGLEAEVRLPSFKQGQAPLAIGTVSSVSADVVVDELTRQTYYELKVAVDASTFPESIRKDLVAGMPAEVIVATGERTVLAYLIQPLGDAMRLGMREQ